MSNREERRRVLMRQAEEHLREENLLALPVDLEALAKAKDIVLEPMPIQADGVSGMLARYGDTFGILYNTRIENIGFQRFCIAHEFGHYFVEGHLDHIPFDGDMHHSYAGFVSSDDYEREADHFAAGLLMPETLIHPIIQGQPDGLCAVEAIEREANASLTASAIRYAGLADAATAVVVSRKGIIDYCFMSTALKSLRPEWPRKGTPVPAETPTAYVAGLPASQRLQARTTDDTDLAEWFGWRRSISGREGVVALGTYGRLLTLLTSVDLLDEAYKPIERKRTKRPRTRHSKRAGLPDSVDDRLRTMPC